MTAELFLKKSLCVLCVLCGCFSACRRETAPSPHARNLVLITIDTLRADHVGAYGYAKSQAAAVDEIAAAGVTFERAYATAPITLPSHATLLTGRYPPGHGSRDNGMRMNAGVPTIATELKPHGFRTAAFVGAFPLDHQFGLDRGFDVYGDRLPRAPNGQLANERPASQVVDDAIAWLGTNPQPPIRANPQSPIPNPFFLWVHVFEPHAPYGDPSDRRPVVERYDQEIGTANRELQRLLRALEPMAPETLTIVAGDHGEAFGEHGEYAHSIFVYDTTLRVPLVMRGPGLRARSTIADPVTLADVAPTALRLLGFTLRDVDGVDLSPLVGGGTIGSREIYAESFAPLVEFGWAPLRSVRSGAWKLIAAPKPELFDVGTDAIESNNLAADRRDVVQRLELRANRYSAGDLAANGGTVIDNGAAERLRALGYVGNPQSSAIRNPQSAMNRPDPKDRRELAARIAQVTSGELTGAALVDALQGIVRDDPNNAQARLRLGIARLQSGDCARAEPELHAAAAAGLPSADIYVGLASCLGRRNDLPGAERALAEAQRLEPDNPTVLANVGILRAAQGNQAAAIESFVAALARDPDLHEARFNLALAYARAGRRADAAAAARDLLGRLPASAPQRGEVERLLRAVQ